MRVDFMIIGAQKCGTTSLATQLGRHRDICFCRSKEPEYFNRTDDWEAGLDQYHSLYSPAEGQICGEASTTYTFLPEWRGTHSRLFAYNPDLKLIYIMRQPVERVISHYAHRLVRGRAEGPPEIAVSTNPIYINRSRYGVQITPYLELFNRENVLLLIFEEYISDQVKILEQIAAFLGTASNGFPPGVVTAEHRSVGEWQLTDWGRRIMSFRPVEAMVPCVPASIRKRVRRSLSRRLENKPEFSRELKQTIWRFFADDVRIIEELLGRRLDIWRRGYG